MKSEVTGALKELEELGTCVIHLPGFIHEKAAIIDQEILWEGSMNILSQRQSREMMRRIPDELSAKHVLTFLGLNQSLVEGYKSQYERLYRSMADGATVQRHRARMMGVGLVLATFAVCFLWTTIATIGPVADQVGMVMRLLTMPMNK